MLTTISQWGGLLALMLSVGNLLWAWVSRPARDVGTRVDGAIERIDESFEALKSHDRRIQRVEDEMRHLPTKDDLNQLSIQLTKVKTELDIVARVVTRIDEFLRAKA